MIGAFYAHKFGCRVQLGGAVKVLRIVTVSLIMRKKPDPLCEIRFKCFIMSSKEVLSHAFVHFTD